MAKYLRPRRGSTNNAKSIVLVKGEMFMEYPNGRIGMEPGRIIVGNGTNACSSINYAATSTNVFQPFITDPSIYIPRFANTATSTGSGSISPAITSIEKMGNGSTSTVTLPTIISAIKEALVYHANSITKLNNDLYTDGFKIDNSVGIAQSLNPYGTTYTNPASQKTQIGSAGSTYISDQYGNTNHSTMIINNGDENNPAGIKILNSGTNSISLSDSVYLGNNILALNSKSNISNGCTYSNNDINRKYINDGTNGSGWGGTTVSSLNTFLSKPITVFWSNLSDCKLYKTDGTYLSTPTGGTIYILKFGALYLVKISGMAATTYSYRTYLRHTAGVGILSEINALPATETGSFLGCFYESSGDIMMETGKTNGVWDTSLYFITP